MLDFTTRAGSPVATLAYRGTVTEADYEAVGDRIDAFLSAHDDARVLIDLTGFEGIGPKGALADTKLSLRHLGDFGRIAVVTDERWQSAASELSGAVVPAEVETFAPTERARAEAWLEG